MKYASLVKHGHSRGYKHTSTYSTWSHMLTRCRNRRNDSYDRYGGRGIKVCKRWLKFENFILDMGERPTGLTLDRINPNLGYHKVNCRWATKKTQSRNKLTLLKITVGGLTRLACEWSEDLGLRPSEVARRVRRGWSLSRAATTPNQAPKQRKKYNEVWDGR
jgi:hypothetical protein